jgi:hypothetical protein
MPLSVASCVPALLSENDWQAESDVCGAAAGVAVIEKLLAFGMVIVTL